MSDLKPEARKRVLRFLGLKSSEEGNLDVFPIALVHKPELDAEPSSNIELICKKCAEEKYGKKKGGFTKDMLRNAAFVKAPFGREHMWVKIKEVTDDCVVGTVDNIPVLAESPRYGEEVRVFFHEIEDVIFKRTRKKKLKGSGKHGGREAHGGA